MKIDRAFLSRNKQRLIYSAFFMLCFLFFFYFTFPFNVLKEFVLSKVNQNGVVQVEASDMSPSIFGGVSLTGVEIFSLKGPQKAKFSYASVSINYLPLFIGNLSFDAELYSDKRNYLEVTVSLPLSGLLSGAPILSSASLYSSGFQVGPLISVLLSSLGPDAQSNPMLGPLVEKIMIEGKLVGDLYAKIKSSDPVKSAIDINLELKDATLLVDDPILDMDKQIIKSFVISAKTDGGSLNIAETSGFVSQDIKLKLNGSVAFAAPISKSNLNIALGVELSGSVQSAIGHVIDIALKGQGGKANVKILGTPDSPKMVNN